MFGFGKATSVVVVIALAGCSDTSPHGQPVMREQEFAPTCINANLNCAPRSFGFAQEPRDVEYLTRADIQTDEQAVDYATTAPVDAHIETDAQRKNTPKNDEKK